MDNRTHTFPPHHSCLISRPRISRVEPPMLWQVWSDRVTFSADEGQPKLDWCLLTQGASICAISIFANRSVQTRSLKLSLFLPGEAGEPIGKLQVEFVFSNIDSPAAVARCSALDALQSAIRESKTMRGEPVSSDSSDT